MTSVLNTTMISIVEVIVAWRSGGHRFDSFLSLGFFFVHACVMLINLAHISLPSLKFVNHLYSLINVNFL